MKVHAGVDAGSGYVHTITGTAAKIHDIDETAELLREDDEVCYGDSGYSGAEKRPEILDNEHFCNIEFRTNVRPSSCCANRQLISRANPGLTETI